VEECLQDTDWCSPTYGGSSELEGRFAVSSEAASCDPVKPTRHPPAHVDRKSYSDSQTNQEVVASFAAEARDIGSSGVGFKCRPTTGAAEQVPVNETVPRDSRTIPNADFWSGASGHQKSVPHSVENSLNVRNEERGFPPFAGGGKTDAICGWSCAPSGRLSADVCTTEVKQNINRQDPQSRLGWIASGNVASSFASRRAADGRLSSDAFSAEDSRRHRLSDVQQRLPCAGSSSVADFRPTPANSYSDVMPLSNSAWRQTPRPRRQANVERVVRDWSVNQSPAASESVGQNVAAAAAVSSGYAMGVPASASCGQLVTDDGSRAAALTVHERSLFGQGEGIVAEGCSGEEEDNQIGSWIAASLALQ
jgi:hypothetical protein